MDRQVKSVSGSVREFSFVVAWVVVVALATGCAENIRQYTQLGDWSPEITKSGVISGDPERDAAAFAVSEERLSEADWRVLVQFAPRHIWEKIAEAKRRLEGRKPTTRPAAGPTTRTEAALGPMRTTKPGQIRQDVRTALQPDGNVKIFYRFQHVGGASVSTTADGNTRRRTVTAKPPDLNPLAGVVKQHLGGKATVVTPLPAENMLVITCEAAAKDAALALMAELDVPSPQVEITARIFEVSSDFDFQYGAQTLIRHLAGDNQQGLAGNFSAKAFADSVVNPIAGDVPDPGSALRIFQVFGNSGFDFSVTFQALVDTGLVSVVAAPRMTVRYGDTGKMLAGREIPIQEAKIVNDNFASERVVYKPIGVQLYVTPQGIGPESVRMHVVAIVSAISGFDPLPSLTGPVSSDVVVNPMIDVREAETYVTVPDSSTLVMSGLRMSRSITRERKIPGLGDLPVLGWMFKSHRSQKRVNDLYFFVTPRIIK